MDSMENKHFIFLKNTFCFFFFFLKIIYLFSRQTDTKFKSIFVFFLLGVRSTLKILFALNFTRLVTLGSISKHSNTRKIYLFKLKKKIKLLNVIPWK